MVYPGGSGGGGGNAAQTIVVDQEIHLLFSCSRKWWKWMQEVVTQELVVEVVVGGTAAGTGANAHKSRLEQECWYLGIGPATPTSITGSVQLQDSWWWRRSKFWS